MRATREWAMVDAGIAAALAAACALEILSPRLVPGVGEVVGNRPVLLATSLAAASALAARRRLPLTVLCVVVGAMSVQQALTTPTGGLMLLLVAMVAAYASSAHATPARGALAGAVIVGGAAGIGEDAGDWAF